MKKLILMLSICGFISNSYGQKVVNFNTSALLANRKTAQDSAMVTLSGGERAWRSSTSQDTITTAWILIEHLNGDFGLEFEKINVSGTDTVQVNLLLFRGHGSPDSSGFSRHQLVVSNANLTTNYWLADSTFVSKRGFTKYALEIRERATQQNDYIINFNHYSPDGRASGANIRN